MSSTPALARRDFLLSLAGAIAAAGTAGFPARLYAASSISVEQFAVLSKTLTQATTALDPDVARTLLGAFIVTGHEAGLAALIADPSSAAAKNAPLAQAIVGAWYSGVCTVANGQEVATFDQALMWSAMTFTKPFGVCGGDTGYWSDVPKS
jgi:hypothetical protein